MGRDNVFYLHLTLLPYIAATGELKTKPTQHSIKELRSIGIQPDALVCRSDYPVSTSICEKLSLFCDVDSDAVIPLETVDNVYEVPLILEESGLGDFIVKTFGFDNNPPDLSAWIHMVDHMKSLNGPISIAVVGKYAEYPDCLLYTSPSPRD